jgi:hypothetical protein
MFDVLNLILILNHEEFLCYSNIKSRRVPSSWFVNTRSYSILLSVVSTCMHRKSNDDSRTKVQEGLKVIFNLQHLLLRATTAKILRRALRELHGISGGRGSPPPRIIPRFVRASKSAPDIPSLLATVPLVCFSNTSPSIRVGVLLSYSAVQRRFL